jgi:hypothetical protein
MQVTRHPEVGHRKILVVLKRQISAICKGFIHGHGGQVDTRAETLQVFENLTYPLASGGRAQARFREPFGTGTGSGARHCFRFGRRTDFAGSFHEAIIIDRNFDSSKEPGAE